MIVNTDMGGVEITQAAMPILLAWIHPDADHQSYRKLLAQIAAIFPNQLQIYLIRKDFSSALEKRYGIDGTPTFLLVQAGRVIQRLLGEVDSLTLTAFVAQNIGNAQEALVQSRM